MKKNLLFLVFIVTVFAFTANAQTGTLHVEISGINEIEGLMSIGLYSNDQNFPDKGKEYKGEDVRVTKKSLTYIFQDVPFGTYSIAIFHDINSNRRLDTNFLGIPQEGYAFSNNQFGAFGSPPSFNEASFEIIGDTTIKIKVEY